MRAWSLAALIVSALLFFFPLLVGTVVRYLELTLKAAHVVNQRG